MNERLKARLSLGELFGLALSISVLGIFIWLLGIEKGYPADFGYYMETQISPAFYYGYWVLPVFSILKLLPFHIAYLVWGIINILSVFFAVRVFGGKPILVLTGYQLFSILYYGQISGILAGGLALCWWGMHNNKWNLAGLGLIIAITKYQVGIPLGLILIWYSELSRKNFIKLMIVPLIIGFISLVVYPLWPLSILQKLSVFPYGHLGISLWYFIGYWSLLFWLPVLIVPMPRPKRFLALVSLSAFAVPYFAQIDLVTLLAFPIGWLPFLGNLGYLFPFFQMGAIRPIVIIPVFCYSWVVLPALYDWIQVQLPTGFIEKYNLRK